ncbi:transaldolase family protein [Kribbella sp. NPDC051936]|uniref:transaldolase family protein n=1 Tax=Kribbella sp. NPDC051936 TaxID=3154946 RepID=UPI0034187CEB
MEQLIGPETVTTLPEATIEAFEDHGTIARTVDNGVPEAARIMQRLAAAGIDMTAVGRTLEDNGIAGFEKAYRGVLADLTASTQPSAASL